MRITVSIGSDSMKDLLEMTHSKKKSHAISKAIESFLTQQKLNLLIQMRGKFKVENNLKKLKELELRKLAKLARFG